MMRSWGKVPELDPFGVPAQLIFALREEEPHTGWIFPGVDDTWPTQTIRFPPALHPQVFESSLETVKLGVSSVKMH